jgi:hypothetical protein
LCREGENELKTTTFAVEVTQPEEYKPAIADAMVAIRKALQDLGHFDDVEVVVQITAAENEDAERCPGCNAAPGDGLTAGCNHPDGCGFWRRLSAS